MVTVFPEGCQRTNQTDVRTFRRLDRAHTAKVGRVHVADLHGGAVAGQTAGAQSGETTLVRHTGQRVVLVHELGELGGAEELLDGGVHRTEVDQGLRKSSKKSGAKITAPLFKCYILCFAMLRTLIAE